MSLKDVEKAIRHGREVMGRLYFLVSDFELSTRYAIIDPIIWALGWETHNPSHCRVEYTCGGGRVDYAFFNRKSDPVVLIEAKRMFEEVNDF